MLRTEAENLYNDTVNKELESIFAEIRNFSADGITSLYYFPPTESLLKTVHDELKEKGYWVKQIEETDHWTTEMVESSEDKNEYYVYHKTIDHLGTKFYRKGIKIWWKKPSFWGKLMA